MPHYKVLAIRFAFSLQYIREDCLPKSNRTKKLDVNFFCSVERFLQFTPTVCLVVKRLGWKPDQGWSHVGFSQSLFGYVKKRNLRMRRGSQTVQKSQLCLSDRCPSDWAAKWLEKSYVGFHAHSFHWESWMRGSHAPIINFSSDNQTYFKIKFTNLDSLRKYMIQESGKQSALPYQESGKLSTLFCDTKEQRAKWCFQIWID